MGSYWIITSLGHLLPCLNLCQVRKQQPAPLSMSFGPASLFAFFSLVKGRYGCGSQCMTLGGRNSLSLQRRENGMIEENCCFETGSQSSLLAVLLYNDTNEVSPLHF